MWRVRLGNTGGGTATGALLAGAVSLLALPSAVLAFSTRYASPVPGNVTEAAPIDKGVAPEGLANTIAFRSLAKGQLFPFTPAVNSNRPDRSITVAVRIDGQSARAIQVRGVPVARPADGGMLAAAIAPTAFKLGVARGFQQFSPSSGFKLDNAKGDTRKVDMPDLATFGPANPAAGPGARFAPRIVMDERLAAGRAPRTFAPDAEDQVDVGGSYRVTRNLDVTAGVRYSQERDRLKPLTDGKQDSQAVYVGTQFRF